MNDILLHFEVAGEPQPQGSKTTGRARNGQTFVREDNPDTKPWRQAVAAAARSAALAAAVPLLPPDFEYTRLDPDPSLFTGPLRLIVDFRFARPKGHFGTGRNAGQLKPTAPLYCDKRPDVDKLVRAIGDALTGLVVQDDSQFVELVASKRYGIPGCRIVIKAAG